MTRLPSLAEPGAALAALATLRRTGRGPVPDVTHRYDAGPLDPLHVAAYASELGFSPDRGVPLTYGYLFAQRAHLGLMLARDFPFPVVGVVHAANDLRGVRSLVLGAPLTVSARVADDATTSSGARYLTLEAVLAQDGGDVMTCRSRYLVHRAPKGGAADGRAADGRRPAPAPAGRTDADAAAPSAGAVIGRYRLEEDAGRRYARLSGDHNPIHLRRWSARLFGFPRPIIHGMHTVARVAALAEAHLGQRLAALDATFRRPIPLPSDVAVWLDGTRFAVMTGDVRAVVGTVTAAPVA